MNGVILLCLIAGQMEIIVAIVNRSHSFPVKFGLLRHIRHLHDALLLLFPIVLVGWVGLWNPGVLRGGKWADLSWFWTVWLSGCALGFVSLIACVLRWNFRRPPACRETLRSNHTNIADLHEAPIGGSGPYQFLTGVPTNQYLHLDSSEKVYNLPLMNRDITILHLTDFHFTGIPDEPYYRSVIDTALQREYDLVVFTGDLLDETHLLSWVPETFGRLRARLGCYCILGNHDWSIGDAEARAMFEELGWTDVAGRAVVVPNTDDQMVIGGTEFPWMGQHPDFDSVSADATRILLSHAPDNLEWARENNVRLMMSGHNHGGQVVLPILGPIYSPSWHGVRHSGGDFFCEPTLLHVCRGLGARHPLRINCPPEIATLTFCSPGDN